MNLSESEEKQYLKQVKDRLQANLERIDERVRKQAKDLQEAKRYLYENKTGMDHAEKVSVRQSINTEAALGETAVARKKRLRKLIESPYFGRIDFKEAEKKVMPVYIGVYSFFDETQNTNMVYDWRAPVSAMYYDFELGNAWYEAPSGKIEGEILLKRQYRIRSGKMEFMLENSFNVHDDILQKELSQASDDKMKNIVATIQQDQNLIIRNETSNTLIIQGVAGSGKTSIALHRIAFLLYRFKEDIESKDILIISPNKVFADYISNVLPELGEEKIPERGMEELAEELLEGKFRFRTFFEQVAALLENNNRDFKERIRFKASFDFLNKLDEYLVFMENEYFKAVDFRMGKYVVPAWFIEEKFKGSHWLPLLSRIPKVTEEIEANMKFYYKCEITGDDRNKIRKAVKDMFKVTNLRALYKDFYEWLGQPDMYKPASRATLEYADVFPLIYLKIRLEGSKTYSQVKHLLVDEMQDYTPVQYAVLSKIFNCRKTILGDVNQSVNPFSSSSAAEIQRVFPGSDHVKLLKSYRSTYEITNFAQRISSNNELEVIERHGREPVVAGFKDIPGEIAEIKRIIAGFRLTNHQSLGIICKTQRQADELYDQLKESESQLFLLTSESASFARGVVLTTAHMAKGLEFDEVIVPFLTAENYKDDMDKGLLYIACTRAMHELYITFSGNRSELIGN